MYEPTDGNNLSKLYNSGGGYAKTADERKYGVAFPTL